MHGKTRVVLAAAALVLAAGACSRDRSREVEQAVRTYLERLVQAYQASDAALVEPLVSEEQALKLTGLIGVKRDAGVVMQAKLLELSFTRVERRGDVWIAETRERWAYRDLRMATGEQAGEASTDSYALRYAFSRKDGKWILETLEFTEPPVVGRKVAPIQIDARTAHGLPPPEAAGTAAGTGGAPPKAGAGR